MTRRFRASAGESWSTRARKLIVCDISGYTAGTPQFERKAYDLLVQAEAGLSGVTGSESSGPVRVGISICDIATGHAAYAAILEALIRRGRTGAGAHLQLSLFDTIADNAANAGIVLGGRPIRPMDADLRWIGALCFRNGQLEETGLAAGVLNHPATSVAWLANKIAPNGLALEAGQVVLAGSFIRPIETRKGDTIQADYGPYGSVSCYFA